MSLKTNYYFTEINENLELDKHSLGLVNIRCNSSMNAEPWRPGTQ